MQAGEPGRGPGPNHDSVLKGTTTQAGQGVWAFRLGQDDHVQSVCKGACTVYTKVCMCVCEQPY